MSNAESLQQNNLRLGVNNNDLNSILDTINTLPKNEEITLQEKAVTPTTEEQNIVADEGYTGLSEVTVAGDSELVPDNIKEGTSIFGVEGKAQVAFDTTQIKSCYGMFKGNNEITEAPLFDSSGAEDMSYMYQFCSNMIKAPSYNILNCTTIAYMYDNCKNLEEIGDFINGDKLTAFNSFVNGCKKLKKAPFVNTKNITSFSTAFWNLSSLESIPQYDTNNVTTFYMTFYGCTKLITIPQLNASKAENMYWIVNNCGALINIGGFVDLGKGYTKTSNNYSNYTLDLSSCELLTKESLMNVINNLYDLNLTYNVANGGTLYRQSLVLGSTNLAKLTADEIAIATNKGWDVT